MRRKRPIIGITGPDRGGGAAWLFTRIGVWLAGGYAVRITPHCPRSIDCIDALVLGGGADVDPKLYNQELPVLPTPKPADEPPLLWLLEWLLLPITALARKITGLLAPLSGQDAARDTLEMRLLHEAIERKLPVLGICRGMQLINVYFGGTLHRELNGFYVEDPQVRTILPRKRILIAGSSRLSKVLGNKPERVNALHNQGVNLLGKYLIAAARDRNNIIQAIEHTSLPFVIGVQWHPEYLPQLPEQRNLFKRLIEEASLRANRDVDHPRRIATNCEPCDNRPILISQTVSAK